MKKLKILLFFISVLILGFVIWSSNPILLLKSIESSSKEYILAGFLVSFFAIMLRVLKWKVLLNNVSFAELYPIQLLGITISNFTPGKAAEPFKAVILKTIKKINVSESLPAIIWERILDILILVGFSIFVVGFISLSSDLVYLAFASIGIFTIVLLFFLGVLKSRKFGTRVFSIFKRLPFLKNVSDKFINAFYDHNIKKRKIILSFLVTFFTWLVEGFVLYLALVSIGIHLNPLFLSSLIALSILIGVASSLPGGIGSFEAVAVFVLSGTGIEISAATAGIIIYRFMSFGLSSLMGGLSFVYLSRKIDFAKIKFQ
jgi:glycosyltransferase 2 family protein